MNAPIARLHTSHKNNPKAPTQPTSPIPLNSSNVMPLGAKHRWGTRVVWGRNPIAQPYPYIKTMSTTSLGLTGSSNAITINNTNGFVGIGTPPPSQKSSNGMPLGSTVGALASHGSHCVQPWCFAPRGATLCHPQHISPNFFHQLWQQHRCHIKLVLTRHRDPKVGDATPPTAPIQGIYEVGDATPPTAPIQGIYEVGDATPPTAPIAGIYEVGDATPPTAPIQGIYEACLKRVSYMLEAQKLRSSKAQKLKSSKASNNP